MDRLKKQCIPQSWKAHMEEGSLCVDTCRGCALSHWLEPLCKAEEEGLDCLGGQHVIVSASLSRILALGFWKRRLSDRGRSLLFLVLWGLVSRSYWWGGRRWKPVGCGPVRRPRVSASQPLAFSAISMIFLLSWGDAIGFHTLQILQARAFSKIYSGNMHFLTSTLTS